VPGPAYAGLIDQLTPLPPGSGSLSVTPVALPGPVFDTMTVKPIASPALTDAASAVLVICSPGHCTVTDACAWTCGLFVACALAVFGYVAQLAKAVGLVTCTDAEPPDAMSPKEQLKVLLLMAQPWTGGAIVQEMPEPVGSGSLRVTDFAAPGPLFPTVIVKPMFVPALTLPASAVLLIVRFGHCTVVDAWAGGTVGLFDAATVAEFG
jgi:hypothetical protein